MKQLKFRYIALFIAIFWCSPGNLLQAQISYTSSHFASVGDSFVVSTVPIFNLGGANFSPTDSNYTWDYSTLNPTSQRIASYQTPNSTGFLASYLLACNANCYTPCYNACVGNGSSPVLCQGSCTFTCSATCLGNWGNKFNLAELVNDSLNLGIITITDVFNLYKKSNSALEQNAVGVRVNNIPLVVENSVADKVYSFPMEYNDTSVSVSAYGISLDSIPGTGINFGFAYKHAQTRTNVVEGWGSLTTPFMQFDSVLKVKSIVHNRDSVVFQGNTITLNDFLPNEFVPDTVITYQWFSKDWGIPVLKVTAWRVGGVEVYQNAEFIDTVRCFDPLAIFGYLPIPATIENGSDSVEVNFYNLSYNANTFSWNFDDPNSADSTSSNQSPSHYFTEEGIYSVTLRVCNTACSFPRCNNLTIPVLVVDNRDTTGIDEYNVIDQGFTVYPVPFQDEFMVQLESTSCKTMSIYTLDGRKVYQTTCQGTPREQLPVDLSGTGSGVFVVKVVTDTGVYTRKIVRTN